MKRGSGMKGRVERSRGMYPSIPHVGTLLKVKQTENNISQTRSRKDYVRNGPRSVSKQRSRSVETKPTVSLCDVPVIILVHIDYLDNRCEWEGGREGDGSHT